MNATNSTQATVLIMFFLFFINVFSLLQYYVDTPENHQLSLLILFYQADKISDDIQN